PLLKSKMGSVYLDLGLSPTDLNETLKKFQWEKLTQGKADKDSNFDILWDNIKELYWSGLEREMAAAIIAFAEFEEHQPTSLPPEEFEPASLKTGHLGDLINLWTPFNPKTMLGAQLGGSGEMHRLEERVQRRVSDEFEYLSFEERRAQGFLQSLGLTDIDFVREYRPEVNLGQHVHQMMLAKSQENNVPYTLCPPCFEKVPHPYGHLEVKRRFPEGKFVNSKRADFGLQLDMWEDQMDGHLLMGFGALSLDRLASGSSMFSRASTRNIFPAGNTHSSIMFGPLIIENGSEYMLQGARISLRNMHNFSTLSLKDLQEFISEPSDFVWSGDEDVLMQTHLAVSQDRHVYTSKHPARERRIMSAQKQVAGGLFTLTRSETASAEREIISEFIDLSKLWGAKTQQDSVGQISDLRSTLKSFAEHMVARIQTTFGVEIVTYLLCFAKRLHQGVKLKYDRVSNNCQDFASAMLFNNDEWDDHLSWVYPRVPLQHELTRETMTFRYMMSFAGRIQSQHREYFVSPLTSSIQLYDSFGHNDSDLIDHAINVRTRDWDGGSVISHDPYLMKNSTMTCYAKDGCSMADHLLDGPHDNLSVLTTHIHRKRALYTVPKHDSGDVLFTKLLVTQAPSDWIRNRLEIIHRLRLLNSYLSIVADEFASMIPDGSLSAKDLRQVWTPVNSRLGRCWSCNKREDRNVIQRPTWLDTATAGQMSNARWTFMSSVWHTSPDVQAKEAWLSRYNHFRRQLSSDPKGSGASSIIPPGTCDCSTCEMFWASRLCSRATRHAASQELTRPEERSKGYSSKHPDYVPPSQLRTSILLLGAEYKVVTDFLKQLTRTPEYLGYEESTELQIEMFPDVYGTYLFQANLRGKLHSESQSEIPGFLEWLAAIHNEEDSS
ncbi:hypothetical protein KAF25_004115, partial [Fusarium avenaceum]